MTWDEIEVVGVPPSPRSDHAADVHVERYLLIFGGGSHATRYNDLHVLDLQTMEWSHPTQQGEIPTPRAGHAGVTVGENWFVVGGGDNKSGASETVVLNMSTLAWSAVTSFQGRVSVASEGLSLVVSSNDGEDVLVSFGGYNGRYNNEPQGNSHTAGGSGSGSGSKKGVPDVTVAPEAKGSQSPSVDSAFGVSNSVPDVLQEALSNLSVLKAATAKKTGPSSKKNVHEELVTSEARGPQSPFLGSTSDVNSQAATYNVRQHVEAENMNRNVLAASTAGRQVDSGNTGIAPVDLNSSTNMNKVPLSSTVPVSVDKGKTSIDDSVAGKGERVTVSVDKGKASIDDSFTALVAIAIGTYIVEFDALTGSKISALDIGAPVVRMSYSPTSGHTVIAILQDCTIRSCDFDLEQTCVLHSHEKKTEQISSDAEVHMALTSLQHVVFFLGSLRE
ncbi:acyl-CoA-binding domain-containing protein 6 [Lathyrus oleraceus]|uniref:Uncharacterized protein n=1 Tax=Pisum sativum TaxID=3888 RepID=A0A9D4VTM6_PEA|nr:acyl-CoA-binding domain-containing protein 6-like [Pisum sativum]KAI5389456.1 hypothetical protein KIW84_074929 [Pisum sativum]